MKRRAFKALAAAAVAFSVASIFFLSDLSSYENYDDYYDPSEYSRRLSGRRRAHSPRERVINELKKQGIVQGDPDYRRLLSIRLQRLEQRNKRAQLQRKLMRDARISKEIWFRTDVKRREELEEELVPLSEAQKRELNSNRSVFGSISVCGRSTMIGTTSDLALLYKPKELHTTCPGANSNKLLLLQDQGEDSTVYGRTGNNLVEFLHALQFAHDRDVQLGIMADSWAMGILQEMFMSVKDDDWKVKFEEAFCVKIFSSQEEVQGYELLFPDLTDNEQFTRQLFMYESETSLVDYIGNQSRYLQTLFRNYNTGEGTTGSGEPVRDMCSGIKSLFRDQTKNAIYSVVHQRSLEHAGRTLLGRVSKFSGCDPEAALHMAPGYIKSILEPIGLLKYPIVLITDGQDFSVLQRLLNDPDIAPMLRLVPEGANWIGGDITLGVMANAFIGNPASTFSGFIAKSRLALGFGQSYLFRAKNGDGEWVSTCGETGVFDKRILGSMS